MPQDPKSRESESLRVAPHWPWEEAPRWELPGDSSPGSELPRREVPNQSSPAVRATAQTRWLRIRWLLIRALWSTHHHRGQGRVGAGREVWRGVGCYSPRTAVPSDKQRRKSGVSSLWGVVVGRGGAGRTRAALTHPALGTEDGVPATRPWPQVSLSGWCWCKGPHRNLSRLSPEGAPRDTGPLTS